VTRPVRTVSQSSRRSRNTSASSSRSSTFHWRAISKILESRASSSPAVVFYSPAKIFHNQYEFWNYGTGNAILNTAGVKGVQRLPRLAKSSPLRVAHWSSINDLNQQSARGTHCRRTFKPLPLPVQCRQTECLACGRSEPLQVL